MKIEEFEFNDWINQWSGTWSILTFSVWGNLHTKDHFTDQIDHCVTECIYTWKSGKSDGFWRASEKKILGEKICALIKNDPNYLSDISKKIKLYADEFREMAQKLKGKDISYSQYDEIQELVNGKYYPLHVQNKVGADFLDADLASKYLPIFLETRRYIENIWDIAEKFIIELAKVHSQNTGYDYRLILACTDGEFRKYLQGIADLPPKEILQERDKQTALLCKNGEIEVISGDRFGDITALVSPKAEIAQVKGVPAYNGIVKGKVKIIFDPNKPNNFQLGEILVTGMTRPDFMPIMKKASAVVTDSGGLLCHAAIVARELKIPTIIGTEVATKVFKDGDLVEVDADKGIVRKVK